MKVRVKFEKTGALKFIGHLDIMRCFQKALRRADIQVTLSAGFNPHMVMSFASPLGVGITSSGEYFDLELAEAPSSREMVRLLNEQLPPELHVVSVRKIPEDKASRCMSLVAAADYRVFLRSGRHLPEDCGRQLDDFRNQASILIWRKTKRSEKETDIRPWIYDLHLEGETVCMRLSAGSVNNLKPELVMQAFGNFCNTEFPEQELRIHREELYADPGGDGRNFLTLEALGEEIE